jgi:hypothetical protein
MHKRIVVAPFIFISLCLFTLARADDANPLLGTWHLKSFVREVAGTGERYNQLGDHPNGYLTYSTDGRMLAFLVSADRPRPRNEPSCTCAPSQFNLHSERRTTCGMTIHTSGASTILVPKRTDCAFSRKLPPDSRALRDLNHHRRLARRVGTPRVAVNRCRHETGRYVARRRLGRFGQTVRRNVSTFPDA